MAFFRRWLRASNDGTPPQAAGGRESPEPEARVPSEPEAAKEINLPPQATQWELPDDAPRHATFIDEQGDEEEGELRLTKLEEPGEGVSAADSPLAGTMEEVAQANVEHAATEPYRVLFRRPTPLLVILDDGQETGEIVRLRDLPLTIGRDQADLRIPHDPGISPRHARIEWAEPEDPESPQLVLRDLDSESGTFVKVTHATWKVNNDVRLGGSRLRLDATGMLSIESPHAAIRRVRLTGTTTWLGRDAQTCQVALDDPMVSPRHARIERRGAGSWHIEDLRSRNGTWLQISQIRLDTDAEVLLGEQRFLLRPRS